MRRAGRGGEVVRWRDENMFVVRGLMQASNDYYGPRRYGKLLSIGLQ